MSSSASPLLAIRLGHLLYRYADRHAVTHTTHCRQRLLVTAGSPLACCKHPLPASRCTAKRPLPTSPTVRCCRLSLLASSPLCPATQYTRTRSAHTTHCKSESTAHTSQNARCLRLLLFAAAGCHCSPACHSFLPRNTHAPLKVTRACAANTPTPLVPQKNSQWFGLCPRPIERGYET